MGIKIQSFQYSLGATIAAILPAAAGLTATLLLREASRTGALTLLALAAVCGLFGAVRLKQHLDRPANVPRGQVTVAMIAFASFAAAGWLVGTGI